MFIETSTPRVSGDKARLWSKPYDPTTGKCMTFWINMYGRDIGTLNVYLSTYNRLGSPIWKMYGSQGPAWRKVQVTISSQTKYQVCCV